MSPASSTACKTYNIHMATAPNVPLVPLEEYLHTTYEHDVEYVDGVLVERSLPTYIHGILQMLLGAWFIRYAKEFGFLVTSETRVETVAGRRYRIPDVLLGPPVNDYNGPLRAAPFAVFEVWSPDDRLGRQTQRYQEFWSRGVREIIVLDPEARKSWRWVENALIEAPIDGISFPGGRTVPFSSADLFQELESMTSGR